MEQLHILHLEDSPLDSEIIQEHLANNGFNVNVQRVDTREDFVEALERGDCTLILADHSLPSFGGGAALNIAREKIPDKPFIIVTGTLGEEYAVEMLKLGASDYVLKSRLERLVPAINRALREAEERAERRRAEVALRASEKLFRSLVESASDMITILDAKGVIQYESPAALRVLGYRPRELDGKNYFDFLHTDDRLLLLAAIKEERAARQTPTPTPFNCRFRHRDGSWRALEGVRTNLLDDPAVHGIVVNSHDVTRQRNLEDQLRQAQKMEAIGRLAGGVAHDFNNLLAVIMMQADLLLLKFIEPNKERQRIEEVKRSAERAATLTQQLLAFSRKQVLQPKVVNLNTIVRDIERMLRRLIGEDILLTSIQDAALHPFVADPSQIEQVLMNLVVNARDAMPQGGTLTIETRNVRLEDASHFQDLSIELGDYALLKVSDTGTGMDEETRQHIYEPFFTTKGAGKGTGLGLSIVYGIVKQSGGYITLSSRPGQGTSFEIYFPRAESKEPEAA